MTRIFLQVSSYWNYNHLSYYIHVQNLQLLYKTMRAIIIIKLVIIPRKSEYRYFFRNNVQ